MGWGRAPFVLSHTGIVRNHWGDYFRVSFPNTEYVEPWTT